VRQLDLHDLREIVRVIPQKSVLFSGTILDNLRFGHREVTENSARAALEAACMAKFEPDAPVLTGGKNFSGGERQRLCIARATIHPEDSSYFPEVLIVDDGFSALDRKTEALLRQNLATYLPETAFVIISQRINSIQNADKILVLEEGKAVGYGTHAELLAQNTAYRGIYESQTEQ
jgi:ATP-binding cassette subfamily B protein